MSHVAARSFQVCERNVPYLPAVSVSSSVEPETGPQHLEELSAEKLHEALVRAHAAGNRARLAFIETLATLERTQLYFELGCPSIAVYGERHFGYRKSQVYECLRVHETIIHLPRARGAFATGRLSWTQLRDITRVATTATEQLWIDFARTHTLAELRAEVRDAASNGRDKPREDGGGLPNLDVTFSVELTRSQHHTLRVALDKLAVEMSASLGGQRIESRDVLLHMAEIVLGSEQGSSEGRRLREEPHHAVLYKVCTRCQESRVVTEEGEVVVDAAEVERVAPAATIEVITPEEEQPGAAQASARPGSAPGEGEPQREGEPERERDRPNPPRLRRQLIYREGLRCGNPHCSRRAEHGHHIRFRSHGGRTELHNETAVCGRCHALIHAGLLSVDGDPSSGLEWSTRGDRVDHQLLARMAAEIESAPPTSFRVDPARMQVESQPSQPTQPTQPTQPSHPESPQAPGTAVVSPIDSTAVESTGLTTPTAAPAPYQYTTPLSHVRRSYRPLVKALKRLGYDREEAEEALVSALTRLHERGEEITEERLVQLALCRNA